MKTITLLLPLVLLTTLLHAADPIIDWKRAGELYQRQQRGEALTEEEKAYVLEARRQRTPAAQRPPAQATAQPVVVASAAATAGAGFDWPQWRGPSRDDLTKETGLLKQWPTEGPKKLWSFTNAGQGYSGFAVVGNQLFTMGTRDGTEVLICLDAAKGTELWVAKLGGVLGNKWGDGPRGTPAVDGDKVYTLGGDGTLVAVQAKDGKELWRNTMSSLGGKIPGWGYTESLLVDGKLVLCTPGGGQGTVAALDKATGKVVWQSKEWTDGAHYSSVVPATINGQAQYVQRSAENVVGLDAKTGAVLWKQAYPGKTAVIPTPIVKGNQVYVTAGYGVGSMSFTIEPGNQVKMVFDETSGTNKVMKNHHGGVILLGDHVYGYSDGLGLACQDFKTGAEVWSEKKAVQKGAISYADGMFYFLEEGSGNVVLIEATPKGYSEKSRFKLDPQTAIRSPQGRIWTHPVISNGRLYLRDQDLIYAYAVK
jgi:outer membrane protein assembly factor BamB